MAITVEVSAGPTRHRFTVAEYYAIAAADILKPGERVELIEGEIFDMAPIGPVHAFSTDDLANEFLHHLGRKVFARVQNPIRLDDGSEPEPDLMLLRPPKAQYRERHPGPSDVLLLVEVSDSTLSFDRARKLPLYARAGIPEVWIVNLAEGQIETYVDPTGGSYRGQRVYGGAEWVAPRAFPECLLSVNEVLGQRAGL